LNASARARGTCLLSERQYRSRCYLRWSNNKNAYFYHRNGSLTVLGINGKKVTKIGDVEVGGLPEGVAFTPDGKYLFVGNYLDQDLSILKVSGTKITSVKRFKLPGHPASLRMSIR
jgi:DNA-binding beta-propeller fold protein YncE